MHCSVQGKMDGRWQEELRDMADAQDTGRTWPFPGHWICLLPGALLWEHATQPQATHPYSATTGR